MTPAGFCSPAGVIIFGEAAGVKPVQVVFRAAEERNLADYCEGIDQQK
jgi:hypothetical protein